MKKIILSLIFVFVANISYSQLPYTWTSGVNPGWTSSNPSNNTLSFQSGCWNTVSTSNCTGTGSWYTYNNNQITSYTSPIYNFTCSTGNLNVTINLSIFLNDRTGSSYYDWLYFQYSTNGGMTWINPVILSAGSNGSGINMSAYSPLTTWTNNNSNRNGWTGNLGTFTVNYSIPSSPSMRFRFIFESDAIVNSQGVSIYYADILDFTVSCPSPLPIELLEFYGHNENHYNILYWTTSTENNNDFFTLERSNNAIDWEFVSYIDGSGTTNIPIKYSYKDYGMKKNMNYYRLSQTDFNGDKEYFGIISIDNKTSDINKHLLKDINILGQEISPDTPGLHILMYSDGSIFKIYK